jgi:hypothetical protein
VRSDWKREHANFFLCGGLDLVLVIFKASGHLNIRVSVYRDLGFRTLSGHLAPELGNLDQLEYM